MLSSYKKQQLYSGIGILTIFLFISIIAYLKLIPNIDNFIDFLNTLPIVLIILLFTLLINPVPSFTKKLKLIKEKNNQMIVISRKTLIQQLHLFLSGYLWDVYKVTVVEISENELEIFIKGIMRENKSINDLELIVQDFLNEYHNKQLQNWSMKIKWDLKYY